MGGTEQQARQTIDRLLELAGWEVCDSKDANISAHRGVAVREFPPSVNCTGTPCGSSSRMTPTPSLPDFVAEDYCVIVDVVGVCDQDKMDSRPMKRKPTVSFENLLQAGALGITKEDVLTSQAGPSPALSTV